MMRVFRGPKSKSAGDSAHEYVANFDAAEAEQAMKAGRLEFNITKEGDKRRSVCTITFDHDDIIPMINGLLARFEGRFQAQQESLERIKEVAWGSDQSAEEKIAEIREQAATWPLR